MEGYNIALKVNSKTLLGRTQDELTISAKIKESLTKDDQGATRRAVTGHDVSFKVSALASLNASGVTTQLDRDDVIALALQKGPSAEITVVYELTGGDAYTGTGVITGYSESSDASADSDATISLDIAISGNFTKVVANNNAE